MTTTGAGRWIKALALFQCWFGLMVIAGSCFEITNMMWPSALPAAIQTALAESNTMAMHRDVAVVRLWVVASNVFNLAVGMGLLIAGVGLWRTRPQARIWSIRCAAAILVSAFLGQIIMGIYVYPAMGSKELIVTMIVSLGVLIYPLLAITVLTRDRVRLRFA